MRLFRERLLARLIEKHAIAQELATKLMAWRHPGFSAHVGEPIAADDTQALENLAGYVTRNPLSLQRLVYLDGQQAVIYKGKHNPTLGRNFETMGPLEWLARMADHIPDPGKHRTLFYGYYANRVRGDRAAEEPGVGEDGRGASQEAPLFRELGAPHREGLPRRPAHVWQVWGEAQDRGLPPRHRSPSSRSSITWASARRRNPSRRRPCTGSCACRSMRRAGRSRRPEDRQTATRSRLTVSSEGA